jgi:hypothetical protein
MEIVAEYQGINTDQGIWCYFHRHWLSSPLVELVADVTHSHKLCAASSKPVAVQSADAAASG